MIAYFFAARILAQRALAAALILALAAALIVNFFLAPTALVAGLTPATTGTTGLATDAFAAWILAHLAFWAATSLARPAALMPPFFMLKSGTVVPMYESERNETVYAN